MLSTILQQPLGEVDVHAQKVLYGWKRTQHGIRMDAYIKEHDSPDVSGSFYDLEAEKGEKNKDNLPFRTRYYHNMIDNRCLKAGDDYTNLRHAYVIMITSFDPFDRNRMMYTVKNRCIEEPDLTYEDGAYTIYLYVSGDPDGLPEDLVQLLRYMKSTTSDNATGSLSALHKMVEELKQDMSRRVRSAWKKDVLQAWKKGVLQAWKKGAPQAWKKGAPQAWKKDVRKSGEKHFWKRSALTKRNNMRPNWKGSSPRFPNDEKQR